MNARDAEGKKARVTTPAPPKKASSRATKHLANTRLTAIQIDDDEADAEEDQSSEHGLDGCDDENPSYGEEADGDHASALDDDGSDTASVDSEEEADDGVDSVAGFDVAVWSQEDYRQHPVTAQRQDPIPVPGALKTYPQALGYQVPAGERPRIFRGILVQQSRAVTDGYYFMHMWTAAGRKKLISERMTEAQYTRWRNFRLCDRLWNAQPRVLRVIDPARATPAVLSFLNSYIQWMFMYRDAIVERRWHVCLASEHGRPDTAQAPAWQIAASAERKTR